MLEGMKIFVLIAYALVGLMNICIGIPLILRRVAPNRTYGFKVEKTLNNPDIWYEANAYYGRILTISSIIETIITVALYFVHGLNVLAYAILCLIAMSVAQVVTIILARIYLRSL